MPTFLKKALCVTTIAALVSGCSTAVTFTSNRPQQVSVNGEVIGVTPVTKSLSDAVWNDYNIVYTDMETGYQTAFVAEKEAKIGAILAGIFLVWPAFLWCYGPKAAQSRNVDGGYEVYYEAPNPANDPAYQEYLRKKQEEADAAARQQEEEYREFQEYQRAKAAAEGR